MCIYLGERADLTYSSQEHVIPAGLGGKRKLPNGYVSDQFNNRISLLEREFMQNSLLSIPRGIIGPGKRGNLQVAKASASKVGLVQDTNEPTRLGLGYIKLGKAYEIPHLVIDTNTKLVSFNMDTHVKDISGLQQQFQYDLLNINSSNSKVHTVIDNAIPVNMILLGIEHHKNGWIDYYLYKHPSNSFEASAMQMNEIGSKFSFPNSPEHAIYLPIVNGTADYKPDYLRVYSKVAFNFLAFLKGSSFVQSSVFDPIRNWIVAGGNNTFIIGNGKEADALTKIGIKLPQDAHMVYIGDDGSNIFSQVYLYGSLGFTVRLTDHLVDRCGTYALICDWRNREEYTLPDYLKTLSLH